MPRPPLPPGTYGKIKTWQDGKTWLARVKFRDYDGDDSPGQAQRQDQSRRRTRAQGGAGRPPEASQAGGDHPQTTMEKVAELWLAEIERAVNAGTRSPGTLDAYRSIYRRHVKPALGGLRVREVDTPVVDRFLEATKNKTVSGARTAKIVISGMMRLAARHGAVAVNPVREVGRIEAAPRHAPKSLTGRNASSGWMRWRPARSRTYGTCPTCR